MIFCRLAQAFHALLVISYIKVEGERPHVMQGIFPEQSLIPGIDRSRSRLRHAVV